MNRFPDYSAIPIIDRQHPRAPPGMRWCPPTSPEDRGRRQRINGRQLESADQPELAELGRVDRWSRRVVDKARCASAAGYPGRLTAQPAGGAAEALGRPARLGPGRRLVHVLRRHPGTARPSRAGAPSGLRDRFELHPPCSRGWLHPARAADGLHEVPELRRRTGRDRRTATRQRRLGDRGDRRHRPWRLPDPREQAWDALAGLTVGQDLSELSFPIDVLAGARDTMGVFIPLLILGALPSLSPSTPSSSSCFSGRLVPGSTRPRSGSAGSSRRRSCSLPAKRSARSTGCERRTRASSSSSWSSWSAWPWSAAGIGAAGTRCRGLPS